MLPSASRTTLYWLRRPPHGPNALAIKLAEPTSDIQTSLYLTSDLGAFLARPDLLNITLVTDEPASDENPLWAQLVDRGIVSRGFQPKRSGHTKFVVDLPGNAASWRLGDRFGDGAVTIKSQTPWNE